MTKPCNFPERVNERRKGALDRMGGRKRDTDEQRHKVDAEILVLYDRIIESARDVRTKKRRAA